MKQHSKDKCIGSSLDETTLGKLWLFKYLTKLAQDFYSFTGKRFLKFNLTYSSYYSDLTHKIKFKSCRANFTTFK